ncbi:MAG: thioredoxin family protein [Bacilli bacterium]|nr:thioredoxin family protein [Bacilli bacterium]MDD3895582.1 thioredoxin family protein [Bacilli bacterium]MDD4407834.1 thioredoxin family protein [Bacilli bacterium]
MKNLENEDLENVLTNDLTLVDYYAEWCMPCQMLSEELNKLESVKVIKVNTDLHQDLSRSKGVMSIPYVEIYKNKELLNSFTGFKTKTEIEKILKNM